ncbi:MAG: hypothetical protein ACMG6E_04085, partial [Candidatus Roizmanbacteria bacterium]
MKKILVIDPYLDVLGGGEKHILSIAKVLQEEGYQVFLASKIIGIEREIKDRFGFDGFKSESYFYSMSFIKRFWYLRSFDFVFYVTDGSYFISPAGKTVIFCMYPKKELYLGTFFNRLKWNASQFISNSFFTKHYIDAWTKKKSTVIYPTLEHASFENFTQQSKKTLSIISVGRFYGHLHSKNHGFLIDSFNKLQAKDKRFKD